MATYTILENSLKTLGTDKVGLTVTLTSGERTKTFYHEVESTDSQVIADTLNALALAFEAEAEAPVAEEPVVTEGVAVEATPVEDNSVVV